MMTKGKYENASMDDLLRSIEWKSKYKERTVKIDIPFLERSLEFSTPTQDEFLRFFDEFGESAEKQYDAYSHLIYDTCPILHDTQLHEALDIKDPYDVVGKLFSAQTVFEIGAELNSEFDINKSISKLFCQYKENYISKMEDIFGDNYTISRDIDQALWAYGHFFKENNRYCKAIHKR